MTGQNLNLIGQVRKYTGELLTVFAALGDVFVIVLGLRVALWVRFYSKDISRIGFDLLGVSDNSALLLEDVRVILFGVGVALFVFYHNGLYVKGKIIYYRELLIPILRGGCYWAVSYVFLCAVLRINSNISRLYVVYSFLLITGGMLLWRYILSAVLKIEFIRLKMRERLIIVGWSDEANQLIEQVELDKSHPYQVLGVVIGSRASFECNHLDKYKILGTYQDLLEIMSVELPEIVILADVNASADLMMEVSRICEQQLVRFKVIPSYFQVLVSGLKLETVSGVPILGYAALPFEKLYNRVLKRIVDIIGSVIGICVAIPIIGLFSIIIKCQSPGPVFYRQVRTGRWGKNFEIIKLRSMVVGAEKSGAQWAKKDDDRRLPIGGFLRAWNLDEVPQFWNVLKGEMSLVGPRPERPELISRFQFTIPHYNARLMSKPGITGWAQVNGLRGDTDLVERVRYDLYYLENWSLLFDFQIMIQTFLTRKNAY